MRNANSSAVLFNMLGGAVLLTVIAYTGYAFFHRDVVSPCAARYAAGKQFALDDASGHFLTPTELQGRAGPRHWGILKNAEIVNSGDEAGSASLRVALEPAGDADHPSRNGAGFVWQMPDLAKATAACLSYRVLLPPKVAFVEAGHLPGFYAASDVAELDAKMPADSFAARAGWRQGGAIAVDFRSGDAGNFWQRSSTNARWPVGRWVPVEQEIVLNTPGAENAVLRMWIDGKLQIENRSLNLRSTSEQGFSGIVSDIGFVRGEGQVTSLQVSPFVVQWR